ncbi:MAG: hypothetical protein ABJK75_10735 [Tateyamaria sp.]|uniref:hypothetical protein n=1 Tax=Tateyamaria sp. TaxID=1929288 RepID=UPI00329DD403
MLGKNMPEYHLTAEQLGELANIAGLDHVVAAYIALEAINVKAAWSRTKEVDELRCECLLPV